MDHRWDERIRQERETRAERERYGGPRIERDPSVELRDRRIREERPLNYSPWEIGAAHYDQRDLYTRNARIEDSGYGRGPAMHPEEGSYAYHRDVPPPPSSRRPDVRELYEHEAWPILEYVDTYAPRHADAEQHEGLWSRVKNALHRGKGPKNWNRSPSHIYEDVCEALAYHGELDATDIEVKVEGREVTLEGTVPDRHSKRLAERIVEGVYGVEDVHNRLTVRRHDDTNDADVAFIMPGRSFA